MAEPAGENAPPERASEEYQGLSTASACTTISAAPMPNSFRYALPAKAPPACASLSTCGVINMTTRQHGPMATFALSGYVQVPNAAHA